MNSIEITTVGSNNKLNKEFKSDGSKHSNAILLDGAYKIGTGSSVKELFESFSVMEDSSAIILGRPKENEGFLTTNGNLSKSKYNGYIARTKEYFSFPLSHYLLFDYDPDVYGYEINDQKEFIKVLQDIDPFLKNCEIGVRFGSSCGIYKDEALLNDKKSMHAYIAVENSSDDKVEAYKEFLIDSAWKKGYGHVKISESGSILQRQVFDAAVFSPERLVFEAEPTLADNLTRKIPEPLLVGSGLRDLNEIPKLSGDGDILFKKAKIKAQPAADKIYAKYENKKVNELVDSTDCNLSTAKNIIRSRVKDNILLAQDKLKSSNGETIIVRDIFLNHKKYDKITIHDPVEPKKGSNKAIIYSNNGLTPIINSFAHGGIKYTLKPDFETIATMIESTYASSTTMNKKFVSSILALCNLGDISADDRKALAKELKHKNITNSLKALDIVIDKKAEALSKGYVDITPKDIVAPTLDNLKVLMDNFDIKYHYDVILKQPEITHKSITNGPNKESAVISLIEKYAYTEGIDPKITNHIPSLANNDYSNPLLDYIKEQHKNYDGKDYIQEIVDTLKSNTVDAGYIKAILEKWLIQCIAAWDYERTSICEGAKEKFESVLVIQGTQGIQKTKFFSALLPKVNQHYIKIGAMLNPSDKDSLMQTTSYAIVELGELDSTFNKADIGALKAFLSNSYDEYRVPYGKTSTKNKRCTSFCGSVNEKGFLRDPTGARRFWPLPLCEIDFEVFDKIDKNMLWAQVYDLYIAGDRWWFDSTDIKINNQILDMHNQHSSYSFAKEVMNIIKHNNTEEISMNTKNIFETLIEHKAAKNDLNELTSLLNDAGYKKNSRGEYKICTQYEKQTSILKEKDIFTF